MKDFRGELKAEYYEPNKHNRSNLVTNKPDRVPSDQWLKLLSYWDQEKTKVYSLLYNYVCYFKHSFAFNHIVWYY